MPRLEGLGGQVADHHLVLDQVGLGLGDNPPRRIDEQNAAPVDGVRAGRPGLITVDDVHPVIVGAGAKGHAGVVHDRRHPRALRRLALRPLPTAGGMGGEKDLRALDGGDARSLREDGVVADADRQLAQADVDDVQLPAHAEVKVLIGGHVQLALLKEAVGVMTSGCLAMFARSDAQIAAQLPRQRLNRVQLGRPAPPRMFQTSPEHQCPEIANSGKQTSCAPSSTASRVQRSICARFASTAPSGAFIWMAATRKSCMAHPPSRRRLRAEVGGHAAAKWRKVRIRPLDSCPHARCRR